MTNPTKERMAALRGQLTLLRSYCTHIDREDCIEVEEVIALLDTIETLQKERDDLKSLVDQRESELEAWSYGRFDDW